MAGLQGGGGGVDDVAQGQGVVNAVELDGVGEDEVPACAQA